MIQIHSFTFNPFQENTYVLSDESEECVIIDPACYSESEINELSEYISVKDQKFAIAGDVLFNGSIGRTDLPGGDYGTLIKSIREKVFPLGDEFKIYPGHGPATTVAHEKKFNPFVGEKV